MISGYSIGMNQYLKSMEHLIRAENTIPLGSQTFSKSKIQYPFGISPLYADRARGAEIWDVDGNRYIDLVSALASITLGYGDKGLEKAVKKQLKRGISMSLPGILEAEVAELIVELVPSAEMVRFGKNGTDATTAAIRLARAYTGRDHIAVCGYHGWQDWFIGSTTRNKGVPDSISALTHKFEYNRIASLKKLLSEFEGKIAAVIMEPMNVVYPEPGFLESVQQEVRAAGALLIFDETITGFRFAKGGAQELFGITPDLATFGKGMANGFPLSAVVGRRDIMMEMEQIFFSGTFGGELLSLASAKYLLSAMVDNNFTEGLSLIGENISLGVQDRIKHHSLSETISLSGHPSWKFINWKQPEKYPPNTLKTYFMQLMFNNGILILNTHNVSLAHTTKIQRRILDAYDFVLADIARTLESDDLMQKLSVKPPESLFKVR
jgi:glutamate-1-semialdehyde 2,1-aminomutase